jgi:SWI/SNF-related matrix-associated actin-dependent regulator of chromatin subfamily A3
MITYRRYDGSLTASEREEVVQSFMCDREVNVMTCSLKACSYGLNLTAATRVFLLDPW